MLREGPTNERVCTWEAFTPLNTLILPALSFPGTHNLSHLTEGIGRTMDDTSKGT